LRLQEAQPGDPHLLAETRFALARASWTEGRHPRALALAAQARQGAEQQLVAEIDSWLAGKK
jgi:hypothetical protein